MIRLWYLFPRWCRLLMVQAAIVGGIFGHHYGVGLFRPPEPPPIPDSVWEQMAFDAELYALQIQAAIDPPGTRFVIPIAPKQEPK